MSKIKSQTDFEAFSSTEALHEINIDVRKRKTTSEPKMYINMFEQKDIYSGNHEDIIQLGIMTSDKVTILPRPTYSIWKTTQGNRHSGDKRVK